MVSLDHVSIRRRMMYGCYINGRDVITLCIVFTRYVDSWGRVVMRVMDDWCVDDWVGNRGANHKRGGWWRVVGRQKERFRTGFGGMMM